MAQTFKYTVGKTINMGNYNSLRLEIGIEVENAESENLMRVVKQIDDYLERKIGQQIREFKSKGDYLDGDDK